MASIYKRTQDKGKKRTCWYISYSDHLGRWRTTKGFTDRGETERLSAKLEHEVMLRKRGIIDPEAEKAAKRRNAPLMQLLADFELSLANNSPRYIKLLMARTRRVADGCGFQAIADVNPEAVVSYLKQVVDESSISNRTYKHYIQSFHEFCNWLVQRKRIVANPVVGMERLNTEIDIRHRRRALTAEEIVRLFEAARTSPKSIQTFDGELRSRLYMLSYMTGLRRNEIGSLTPRSFNLASSPPTVTVEAAFSKHRRRDVLPLHPELVAMLRPWLLMLDDEHVLFPKLGQRRTWFMVKKDLERAGIPYKTPEGIADFHAAGRHTHITELLRNGATLPEARQLARHADVKMTMRYTHIGIDDQARALKQLPWNGTGSGDGIRHTTSEQNPNAGEGWECIGSESGVSDRHTGAAGDAKSKTSDAQSCDANPSRGMSCRDVTRRDTLRKKSSTTFDSRRLHFVTHCHLATISVKTLAPARVFAFLDAAVAAIQRQRVTLSAAISAEEEKWTSLISALWPAGAAEGET